MAREAPIYGVVWDERHSKFYEGDGKWTHERDKAMIFGSLQELMSECRSRGIQECRVVELFPRTGSYGLHLGSGETGID